MTICYALDNKSQKIAEIVTNPEEKGDRYLMTYVNPTDEKRKAVTRDGIYTLRKMVDRLYLKNGELARWFYANGDVYPS